MICISLIMPAFKRIEQTLRSLKLIFDSSGFGKDYLLEVILTDSTPNDTLETAVKKQFGDKVIYTRPKKIGVAANKNQGAKIASYPILIFCDSDIEVEKDTILKTIKALEKHEKGSAVSGRVFWRGGREDGKLDRPRDEDRMLKKGETFFVEAIYSRFMATYKQVFREVGGYDEEVFNMRGEGSDLSIRYWQAGYPLVYDPEIIVHHVHEASDSIALRTTHPEWGIAKDLLLLAYKYDLLEGENRNFLQTVASNFEKFGQSGYYKIIQGIGNYLEFITKVKPIIDKQKKKMKPVYNFKFLEIFSNKDQLERCLQEAKNRLRFTRDYF